VDAPTAQHFPLLNGATGKETAKWEAADKDVVYDAVRVAKEAQKEWAKWSPTDRGRVLSRAASLLDSANDELAQFETLDTSRPIQETDCVDIVCARDAFEYYGGLAPTIGGEFIHQPNQSWAYTVREPLGVVCGIGAWNYPIQAAAWKAAPALACGNAIIFKPAEDTPSTALHLGAILEEAGLPKGLFNVVLGARETGELLSSHEGISKISFTGSRATGESIFKSSANTLKGVQMELGGKSPLMIFEDADLDEAVSGAMMANWYSTGQVCSNGTRVFVQSSIKEKFMEKFVERTKKLVFGDPFDPATQIGPLINHKHLRRVQNYIEIGKSEGATLLYGGEKPSLQDGLQDGAYLTPVIFDNCHDDMRIVKEEIFGPVASVLSFDTEEEVIRRANDTEYGLSAGVFTKDLTRAHRVVREVNAGTTWINNYNLAPAELPWTGHKGSGIGISNGIHGIAEWTQIKSVYVEMDKIDCPYA